MRAAHKQLEAELAGFTVIVFNDCIKCRVDPFSHQRPLMLSCDEPTFDGSRHFVERQILATEVVELVMLIGASRATCEDDRKRPVVLVVVDVIPVTAPVEQAHFAVKIVCWETVLAIFVGVVQLRKDCDVVRFARRILTSACQISLPRARHQHLSHCVGRGPLHLPSCFLPGRFGPHYVGD